MPKVLQLLTKVREELSDSPLLDEIELVIAELSDRKRPGNPRLDEARRKSAEVIAKQAEDRIIYYSRIFKALRAAGNVSNADLVHVLNEQGVKPPRAEKWTLGTVHRIAAKVNALG